MLRNSLNVEVSQRITPMIVYASVQGSIENRPILAVLERSNLLKEKLQK